MTGTTFVKAAVAIAWSTIIVTSMTSGYANGRPWFVGSALLITVGLFATMIATEDGGET